MSALALVSTALAISLGIVGRHDRGDSAFLELGAKFEAVGLVHPDGACTLIGPNWVLTAAHVAGGVPLERLRVSFGDREVSVKRVIIHPDGKLLPGRPPEVDLALMELDAPVEGVSPMNVYRKTDELGKTITVAGFGDLGNGTDAPKRSDGKRRAATNVVTDAGPKRLFFVFDEPPNGLELEGVSGPGDSGGPAIIVVDGTPHVAGVSSASMNGRPGRYGVTDVYTRVSSYAEWIAQTMGLQATGN